MRSRLLAFGVFIVAAATTIFLIASTTNSHWGSDFLRLSHVALRSSTSKPTDQQVPAGTSSIGTSTKSNLPNWKSYQDQLLGYRFAYPADWQTLDTHSVVSDMSIMAPDGAELKIMRYHGDHGISPCVHVAERRNIAVAGTNGTEDIFRYSSDDDPYVTCGITNDQVGRIAQISLGLVHGSTSLVIDFMPSRNDVEDTQIFDTILRTFRFQ